MTKITNRIYILLISFASTMVALVFNLIGHPLFGHRLVYSACVCGGGDEYFRLFHI